MASASDVTQIAQTANSFKESLINAHQDALTGIKGAIASMYCDILNAGNTVGLDNWLRFQDSDLGVVNTVWKYVAPIGLCMCLVYFLIELNKILLLQGQDFTLNSLGAVLLKLGISWFFISRGAELVGYALDINNALVNLGADLSNTGDTAGKLQDAGESFLTYLEDVGLLESIGILVMLFIVWLVAVIASFALIFQAVSRKLEMLVRVALAPVALGDMYNGEQSNGFRYLKKILALGFWGLAIEMVVAIGGELSAEVIDSIFSGNVSGINVTEMASFLLFPLAEAGIAATLKQVSCDLFGVS